MMMKKVILAVVAALVLGLGLGVGIERVRAQSQVTLADARLWHIGIGVSDIDKVIDTYAKELNSPYNPPHTSKCAVCEFTKYGWDADAGVRTSEIRVGNGFEIHLMQGLGHSPWSEMRKRHGEGALDHVSFETQNLPGIANIFLSKGGKVVAGDCTGKVLCYVEMPNLPFLIEIINVERGPKK